MRTDMITPCAQCPFRTTTRKTYAPRIVEALCRALVRGAPFVCQWQMVSANEQMCAGAMIVMAKMGLREVDMLDLRANVWQTFGHMIQAYEWAKKRIEVVTGSSVPEKKNPSEKAPVVVK